MSDGDASKTAMQIAASLAGDVYKDGLQPAVQTIGEALAGIFKAVGHYPRYWGMMSDISLENKQAEFRERLELKVSKINEDKKVLPKPNILGPSIQALEYGIFDDHLSEMFASLIASAMDRDTAAKAHPSFVDIIRQLTSDEAKFIKAMKEFNLIPIVSLRRMLNDSGAYEIVVEKYHVFAQIASCERPDLYREIVENLERLKLIDVELGASSSSISEKSYYLPLKSKLETEMNVKIIDLNDGETGKTGEYRLTLGFMKISAFGRQFVEVCSK